jgi:uncharacterized protein (TIGR03000 family)
MNKSTQFFAKAGLLAAVILLANAQPSFAQRGPNGHVGGFGTGHPGGGVYPGGFYRGGFYGRGGYYGGGIFIGGGCYGYPYGYYGPGYYDLPPYGPGYYGLAPYSYYTAPVAAYAQPPSVFVNPGYQPQPNPQLADNTALVVVILPADAELWFDGVKTVQKGGTRMFASPPLTPGKTSTYQVRAAWTIDGFTTNQTYSVSVEAGKRSTVNFYEELPLPKKN